jgi:hypothetical protein
MLDPRPTPAADPPAIGDVTRYVETLVRDGAEIVLSVNGQVELRVCNPFARERLVEMLERLEYIESVQEALDAVNRGEGIPFEDVMRRMREKHGIPD